MEYINRLKEFIGRHKKAAIISAVAAVVLVLVILALTLLRPYIAQTGQLYLNIAPSDALVTIDDQNYTKGQHTLSAGSYTVTIAKDGFETQTVDFTIEVGKDTIVTAALEPTDNSNTWYIDHPADDTIYTQVADQNAELEQAEFLEKYPVMNYVPYTDTSKDPASSNRFKIDADYDSEKLSLSVMLNTCSDYSAGIYKQAALDWLASKDVDLSPYTIEFTTLCGVKY